MNICLFTKEEISKPLPYKDERAQHLIKILHKKEGDSFSAGIIEGKAGTALITKIETFEATTRDGKKTYTDGKIYFSFTPETDGKLLHPLKLIVGFPRPIQLKRLLRDVAGLGVEEVHLTATELTEKSYLNSDLAQESECYKMLLEGTEQAASTHVPKIFIHDDLSKAINSVCKINYIEENKRLLLDNIRPQNNLYDYLQNLSLSNSTPVVAAIGSERGWTENERKLFLENNFTLLSMGSRVLRTETACTVASSLILARMGVLD